MILYLPPAPFYLRLPARMLLLAWDQKRSSRGSRDLCLLWMQRRAGEHMTESLVCSTLLSLPKPEPAVSPSPENIHSMSSLDESLSTRMPLASGSKPCGGAWWWCCMALDCEPKQTNKRCSLRKLFLDKLTCCVITFLHGLEDEVSGPMTVVSAT